MDALYYNIIFISVYFLACIVVAVVASDRGWFGAGVFIVCAMSTPIVGAILYSPYKQEAAEEKSKEKEIIPATVE